MQTSIYIMALYKYVWHLTILIAAMFFLPVNALLGNTNQPMPGGNEIYTIALSSYHNSSRNSRVALIP